tara:strand:+ start:1074 stop:1505 length:432 start_codon:yes stop_codon:yes gene_type:complete
MSFNFDNIQDKKELRDRAMTEAKKIHARPKSARGRSLKVIYETRLYGGIAEQYLLETGWMDDEREYMDLIDPYMDFTEIKTTEHKGNIDSVLGRCEDAKRKLGSKFANIVYLFINDKKSKEFTHEGIYYWNPNSKRYRKISEW